MGAQAKIGAFGRWVLTWPALVVFALNIENATSEAGYATIINQHWKDTQPVLKEIYEAATSAWVLYPSLILLGAVIYEWVRHTSNRMEADGSAYRKMLVRMQAESLANAFKKDGLSRKLSKSGSEIPLINRRLLALNLPSIPPDFSGDDQLNLRTSIYLLLIARGHDDEAIAYLGNASQSTGSEPQ